MTGNSYRGMANLRNWGSFWCTSIVIKRSMAQPVRLLRSSAVGLTGDFGVVLHCALRYLIYQRSGADS